MSEIKKIDESKINRLEVINHAKNNHPVGRLLTLFKGIQDLNDFNNIELQLQDGGKTLKIFIN